MNYARETACPSCGDEAIAVRQPGSHWYTNAVGLLILLLPKCPFCVVAYTSSMALCGAPSLVSHHTDWGAWLALALAVVCLGSIAVNYRGTGTRTALLIALSGISLLLVGLFTPNAMIWYYAGAVLLFGSSFYNGRGYRWLSRFI